jgi:hypothetical protein
MGKQVSGAMASDRAIRHVHSRDGRFVDQPEAVADSHPWLEQSKLDHYRPAPGGGTQRVELATQTHYTQYTSACEVFELPQCIGSVTTNTVDIGSQWRADITVRDAQRSYEASEYVCRTSSYYPTSFWLTK